MNMDFNDFDMRSDFSFPVYVGFKLKEFGDGIKGIDPDNRFAAQVTRTNGVMYLDLSVFPSKTNYHDDGIIFDEENKIMSQDDSSDWYATTWSGDILFVLHKYLRVGSTDHHFFNKLSQETSRWIISDFDMVNQFMLDPMVYQAKVYMDYIYSWFNVFHPNQDLTQLKSIIVENLEFQSIKFTLNVRGEGNRHVDMHSVEKTTDLCLVIDFEEPQQSERVYEISSVLRNMLQVLIGKKVGIYKIILNRNKSWNNKEKLLEKKDERENWFIQQSFLPEITNDRVDFPAIRFDRIKDDFDKLLHEYFNDTKVQSLVAAFLTVSHYDIPLRTAIVTLVSGVESYYNEAKYDNGSPIKSAIKKLTRFSKLMDNPQEIIDKKIPNINIDINDLLQKLVDSRDYFVHGDKSNKFTSETDLIPYLMKFEDLYQEALCNIITLKMAKNN